MNESPDSDDRIGRTVDEHRLRSLRRLDALASRAAGKHFASAAFPGTADFVTTLARMITRDLTAIGITVSDWTYDAVPGGVWLAPAPGRAGVIVTWAQHEASATAFGLRMHAELQRHMNLIVFEILHTLGYPVERYGPGGTHVITRCRPPLDGHDLPPGDQAA